MLPLIDDHAILSQVYDAFVLNYQWLTTSQLSPRHTRGFAWVGRSADGRHTLTSGIDDYPRGYGGFAAHEQHVDLLAWIAWAEGILAQTAQRLGKSDDAIAFRAAQRSHVKTLNEVHWNPDLKAYCDIGVIDMHYPHGLGESRGPVLQVNFFCPALIVFCSTAPHPLHISIFCSQPNLTWVPHIGYVGLIPFALQLVDPHDTAKLGAILTALESPSLLRAKGVGIRSLSKSDVLFGRDEDYWRGAVWININYLCLQALGAYSVSAKDVAVQQRAKKLYEEIRSDVTGNIFRQWKATGFLFENYDSETGAGRGTRPFTGWSTLVALMMQ